MDLGLRGKAALVAGASQGIGKAIAERFAQEGARVSICARGEEKLQETAESIRKKTGGEVLAVTADMTAAEDIQRFVGQTAAQFGRLDIVVTNAGGPPPGEFMQFTDADWEKAFRLSFLSALRLAREAVPHLKKAGGGRIINLSSYAVREPVPGLVLSNALRSGVIGWAKTISRELARDRILVNSVCPGRIDTERHRKLNEDRAKRWNRPLEEVHKEMQAEIPLGRYGAPEEVADLVVFLASERAAYITGVTIQVDGGLIRGMP
jgi:3-oxoacyl-[acyl-carrier protein] reductase